MTPRTIFPEATVTSFETAPVSKPTQLPATVVQSTGYTPFVPLTSAFVEAYGTTEMETAAKGSDAILNSTSGDDSDEFVKKLGDLVLAAKGFDPKSMAKAGGFFGGLKGMFGNAKERFVSQFRTLDGQITTLTGALDIHANKQRQRIVALDGLFDENIVAYKALQILVTDGRTTIEATRKSLDAQLAQNPTDALTVQYLNDQSNLLARFEKRVADLDIAMTLAMQTAPEIRLIEANAGNLIDKFQSLKTITIPAWKKQFALYVIQLEQKKSAEIANTIDDATNESIRKNADMLRTNAGTITKAAERAVVDIETVEHVNVQLIGTIEDIKKIHADAALARQAATAKLDGLRKNLVASLGKK